MHRILKISLLLSMFLAFACSKKENTTLTAPPSSEAISTAEYAVLSAVVDSLYLHDASAMVVVHDSTNWGTFMYNRDSGMTLIFRDLAKIVPSVKDETMQDYRMKNESSYYVNTPKNINPACILYSAAWQDSIWNWQKFYQMYPNALGLMTIGRVGFSSDGQQALAYVGLVEGRTSGAGFYHVLSFENSKWRIIGSIMIWIS